MSKTQRQQHKKPQRMYKHSYGHYRTEMEAHRVRKELQERYPKKKFEVVREKRSNNRWAKFCVCVFVPEKGKSKTAK
jgi:hypothetical protein